MIVEKLIKLTEQQRIAVAILTVILVAALCYFLIGRNAVMGLEKAETEYTDMHSEYADTINQLTGLEQLQKQFGTTKEQIEECQQHYCTTDQALQFFENINTMAVTYNLKPVSRIISEPEQLAADEKNESKQRFLQAQSATVEVIGNYFDIVDFVTAITDRSQKVFISNLRIALLPGEKSNPKASFKVSLLVNTLEEKEQ
ncbi:MAG: type 4a pilus biogenesis protein PilO [Planctomycetes bacterium]|nr:type 4a pilus biogenesis protein PilO [Planctomycetota bacterium]